MTVLVDDIRRALGSFIEEELLDGRQISGDEDLLLSGSLDSLAVMSVIARMEQLTGRKVPPEDVTIENFTSLDAMTAYVGREPSA